MAVVRNVVVRLGADASELQRALAKAQKQMEKFGEGMKNVGASMTKAITLPIAGLGVAAIKTAADFEQGMSNIKAVSGATGKEMDDLRKLAMKMGADTSFSAKEAASGIEELSKAGLTTAQILDGGLKGALSLAAAGNIELADAAEIASTALNAFKKDGLSVAKAADILAGAANASATDVGELKFGLSAVSAVASAVGLSFKDTVTSLALFAQNGLKGSDAGTSLKTMLMRLQPSTKEQISLFKKLNLLTTEGESRFYDSAGSLRSLDQIAQILQTSMYGMSDAQRLAAMETMFGSDAIRGANILYGEGATGANNMAVAMGKVTAEAVAAEKLNNLNGALEQLKGSVETLGIQIGTLFLPYLTQLANKATEITNGFMGMDSTTQKTILTVLGIAAAIGPVIFIAGQLITSLGAISGAMSSVAGLFAGVAAGPVLLIIAGIAAVVAAFAYLWNTNKEFRDNMIKAWEMIKSSLISIWSSISALAIVAFNRLKDFWAVWGTTITAVFKVLITNIVWIFQGLFQTLQGVFQIFEGLFTGNWKKMWEGIVNIFGGIGKILQGAILVVWDAIKLVAVLAWAGITTALKAAWDTIANLAVAAWNGMGEAIKSGINANIAMINKFLKFLNNVKITVPSVSIPGVGSVGGFSIGLPQIPAIPMLKTGTNNVPEDMVAMLHKGEAVVPKQYNDKGSGSNNPIVIYLDGKRIYESIDYRLGGRLVSLGGV